MLQSINLKSAFFFFLIFKPLTFEKNGAIQCSVSALETFDGTCVKVLKTLAISSPSAIFIYYLFVY